jgi:hypothetical protein
MRHFSLALVIVAAVLGASSAAEPPFVQLYRLRLLFPSADGTVTTDVDKNGLMSIDLAVHLPEREPLSVDIQKSKLLSLTDDKGTNLAEQDGKVRWVNPGILARQKDVALIYVTGHRTPARGAKSVRLVADLVIRCGKGSKVATMEGFKLEVGAKTKVGPVEVLVGADLMLRHEAEQVRKIEIVDQAGTPLHESTGRGSSDSGKLVWSKRYPLRPASTAVTIKVEAIESFDDVSVPINLEIGVAGGIRKDP